MLGGSGKAYLSGAAQLRYSRGAGTMARSAS